MKKEQKRTINGFTLEFESEILKDLKEIEKQRKNAVLKTYNSVSL